MWTDDDDVIVVVDDDDLVEGGDFVVVVAVDEWDLQPWSTDGGDSLQLLHAVCVCWAMVVPWEDVVAVGVRT